MTFASRGLGVRVPLAPPQLRAPSRSPGRGSFVPVGVKRAGKGVLAVSVHPGQWGAGAGPPRRNQCGRPAGCPPGQFGTAFEFPGPSAKITVPSADDLNPHQSPLTVSAYLWVPSSLTGGDYNTPTARSTLPAGPRTASTDRSGSTTAPGTRSSVTSPTPRPMSPSTASRARSRPERSGASPTRSR